VSCADWFMHLRMSYKILNISRIMMILHFYRFENGLTTKDLIPLSLAKCSLRSQWDFCFANPADP